MFFQPFGRIWNPPLRVCNRNLFLCGNSFLSICITHPIITQIGRENNISAEIFVSRTANQICLSVGATIGRPRAFDERPYKTISNILMRTGPSEGF